MSEKIYCGSGKEITFQDGGTLLKVSIGPNDLEAINKWSAENNGWTNLKVCRKREPDQRGNTHYMEIDQWKPTQQGNNAPAAKSIPDEDVIPFY